MTFTIIDCAATPETVTLYLTAIAKSTLHFATPEIAVFAQQPTNIIKFVFSNLKYTELTPSQVLTMVVHTWLVDCRVSE